MQKQGSKKQGFTLAEILITLTVIGVVAALTIPSLLQNTNQAELKTALKRNFADLQQATLQIINNNGGSLVNAFPDDVAGSESLKNAFKDKLSYIKDCSGDETKGGISGGGASALGCWHGANEWQYLNNPTSFPPIVFPGFILSNGTIMYLGIDKSDCSDLRGDFYKCGAITFDVNGFKKPNVVGKDIFSVFITNSGLIPLGARGWYDPSTDCVPTRLGARGWGCTAKYLYD